MKEAVVTEVTVSTRHLTRCWIHSDLNWWWRWILASFFCMIIMLLKWMGRREYYWVLSVCLCAFFALLFVQVKGELGCWWLRFLSIRTSVPLSLAHSRYEESVRLTSYLLNIFTRSSCHTVVFSVTNNVLQSGICSSVYLYLSLCARNGSGNSI